MSYSVIDGLVSSFHELMQSCGVRRPSVRPSVCLSVCPSVNIPSLQLGTVTLARWLVGVCPRYK